MKCLIIAAGEIRDYDEIKTKLDHYDFCICADAGAVHAEKLGIAWNLLMGDFDSFQPKSWGENSRKFQSEKDDTDTMLAVKEAIKIGCDEIHIIGALGGRFDHTMANLQSLVYMKDHGSKGFIIDEQNLITVLDDESVSLKPMKDHYFSLFAINGETEVTIRHAKYTLNKYNMTGSYPIGISNEFLNKNAEITVNNKVLLVFTKK